MKKTVFVSRLILKSTFLFFFFWDNSGYAQKKAIPKDIETKIDDLAKKGLKINETLSDYAHIAYDGVESSLRNAKITKADFERIKFGISVSDVLISALKDGAVDLAVSKMPYSVGGFFSKFIDNYQAQEKERAELISKSRTNDILEIIRLAKEKNLVLIPRYPNYENELKIELEQIYGKDPKNGLKDVEAEFNKINNYLASGSGDTKYQTLLYKKAILEEIVKQIHQKNAYEFGFFKCTVKSSQTCYFKEWYENKGNCAMLRDVQFSFSGPLDLQLSQLVNEAISQNNTMSGIKKITIFDFDFPITYRIYQPFNPGSYLLKASLKKATEYDRDNIVPIAPSLSLSADVLGMYETLEMASHIKNFTNTIDNYGKDLPVFTQILKRIEKERVVEMNKTYLKGQKLM